MNDRTIKRLMRWITGFIIMGVNIIALMKLPHGVVIDGAAEEGFGLVMVIGFGLVVWGLVD